MGTIDVDAAHKTLLADRDRLVTQISRLGGTVNLSETSPDLVDVGSAVASRNTDLALLDSKRTKLADVQAALAAICDGTYGTCTGCSGTIDPDRLDCLPATTRCRDCSR